MEGTRVRALFTAFKLFHVKGLRKFGNYIFLVSLLFHLFLHRKSFDVIHVHSATVSALGVALAGRWLRKPTVMKVMASGEWSDFRRMRRGGEIPWGGCFLRWLRHVDRVICVNREAGDECEREGFPAEKRVSIPNGFPALEVVPVADYPEKGEILVTFVGRLDAQKNPALLMNALHLAAVEGGGPRIRARFLGDGPQKADLIEESKRLGLESQVEFLGRVENVPEHLRATDIFVLPSLSEGVSNALLEAMAHGLPCIATAIPGNTDLILDRRTGLLVEPGDPCALSRAILEVARDCKLRASLGRAGRAQILEHFDMEGVARRYAELYRSLLAAAAPAE
jgi:glycosyltransferase involved in cell wall biosynthesis